MLSHLVCNKCGFYFPFYFPIDIPQASRTLDIYLTSPAVKKVSIKKGTLVARIISFRSVNDDDLILFFPWARKKLTYIFFFLMDGIGQKTVFMYA